MSVEFRLSEIGSIPSRADLVDTEMTDASDDGMWIANLEWYFLQINNYPWHL